MVLQFEVAVDDLNGCPGVTLGTRGWRHEQCHLIKVSCTCSISTQTPQVNGPDTLSRSDIESGALPTCHCQVKPCIPHPTPLKGTIL